MRQVLGADPGLEVFVNAQNVDMRLCIKMEGNPASSLYVPSVVPRWREIP